MKFWAKRTVGPIDAIHPATGKVIEVDPQRDAKISSDLDTELRRLPGTLSWYRALMDTAEAYYREAKHEEHNAEEDLYVEVRATQPKATETAIKTHVKKHPRMRKAYRTRMDAQTMLHQLKSAVEVMTAKRWILSDLVRYHVSERHLKDSD